MPYSKVREITETTKAVHFVVSIDESNVPNSSVTITYNTFIDDVEKTEKVVSITAGEAATVEPSIYAVLTKIADAFNPKNPDRTVPKSEQPPVVVEVDTNAES